MWDPTPVTFAAVQVENVEASAPRSSKPFELPFGGLRGSLGPDCHEKTLAPGCLLWGTSLSAGQVRVVGSGSYTLGLLLKRAIRGGELVSHNPASLKLPAQSKAVPPASSAGVTADLGALPLGFGAAQDGCSLEGGSPEDLLAPGPMAAHL